MPILLCLIACIVAGVALLTMTQATMGATLMAGACFLGILARVFQAQDQFTRVRNRMQIQEDQMSGLLTQIAKLTPPAPPQQ